MINSLFNFEIFKKVFTSFFVESFAALCLALLITLIGSPLFIKIAQKKHCGQFIRRVGPKSHYIKEGTPTMGGILIIASIITTLICWTDLSSVYLWAILFALFLFGLIGFFDDFLKLQKHESRGLGVKSKLIMQIFASLAIAIYLASIMENRVLYIPFIENPELSIWFFILFTSFVIIATSNAVNLADGIDGLAISSVIIITTGLASMAFLISDENIAKHFDIVHIKEAKDIFIVSLAIIGASLGFWIFNRYPAKVFMGDVGALALGAVLAVIAITLRLELIFMVMSGIFVLEALSVIIQVISFKLTKKRVFRMAPLHHHFELKGYTEPKIARTSTLITLLLVLIASFFILF